jgi:hypothetical protein
MRVKTIIAATMASTLAASAAAAELDIGGNYGNESGCRVVAGEHLFDDSLLYLTPRNVVTYASYCSFLQVLRTESGAYVVTVICGEEGEATETLGMMRIQKAADGSDAYEVYNAGGYLWGRADRCS